MKMEDLDHAHTDQGKLKTEALKQAKIRFQNKLETLEPSSNQYELNRDMVIWASLDLEPFMFTGK